LLIDLLPKNKKLKYSKATKKKLFGSRAFLFVMQKVTRSPGFLFGRAKVPLWKHSWASLKKDVGYLRLLFI